MEGTTSGTEVAVGNTKATATKKFRNFCFTSYQGKIEYNSKNMKYLLQGIEICPNTNREHIQGFVIYKNPRTIGGILKERSIYSFCL